VSKISKLIKNPTLFFQDMVRKHAEKSLIATIIEKTGYQVDRLPQPEKVVNTALNEKFHANFLEKHVALLHSGEGVNAGVSHLNLWIPFFVQSNINFIVLVRNIALYNTLIDKYPKVNIVFCKRPIDIENLSKKLPYAKTVFYTSSTGNNIHLVRFEHMKHIFIGHGDSDKASSANKALRLYDEIWTAGQAHIDRFKNSGFETNHIQFKQVGRPSSYHVIKAAGKPWTERSLRVLYLPTWEGFVEEANYSSIEHVMQMMREVAPLFNDSMSVKFHPLTGSREKMFESIDAQFVELKAKHNLNILSYTKEVSIDSILNLYNIFICDISAVVTECLAANGPIFVYIPKNKDLNIAQSEMRYEDYCYTFSSVEELSKKLNQVLSDDDYLKDNREKALDYLLNYDATLSQKFIAELRQLQK